MTAVIRDARPDDAVPIAEIEQRVFGSDAWSEAVVREELTGPHRWYSVIQQGHEIVGYAGVLVVGADADVQTIAVIERVRGAGHGRRLFDLLLAHARERGAERIFLEVRADNPIAIGLYERSGFDPIARRTGYYQPDGIDAVIMQKTLTADESENHS